MITRRAALLVIDIQHEAFDGTFPCVDWNGAHAREIIPRVNELITASKEAGMPIVYLQEVHRASGIDFGRELDGDESEHCMIGTPGVEYMEDILRDPEAPLVRKVRYNAFMGTDLPYVLNGLRVLPHDTLILCGGMSNVCVHYTGAAAHQHDYRIKVVEDCCFASSHEAHDAAMTQLEYLQHGARVTLEEMLAEISEWAERRELVAQV
jgi:biuret amidohydrolase